jgi:hypothetical protein
MGCDDGMGVRVEEHPRLGEALKKLDAIRSIELTDPSALIVFRHYIIAI